MSSNEVIENDEKSCGITLLLSVPLLISFNRNCSFSSFKIYSKCLLVKIFSPIN